MNVTKFKDISLIDSRITVEDLPEINANGNSHIFVISKSSIFDSQVDEHNSLLCVIDEFKAEGHCEDEAGKLAFQLLEKENQEKPILLTTGSIILVNKNGARSKHDVKINVNLHNDHYINSFVKNQLNLIVEASNKINPNSTSINYSAFLKQLDKVYIALPKNNDIAVYEIKIDALL